MRLAVLLMIVVVTGCSATDRQEAKESKEQMDQIVRNWLQQLPHSAMWGIMKWESDEDRRRARAFNLEQWVEAGKKIPKIEIVLQKMLKENAANDSDVDPSPIAFALGSVGSKESVPILIECLNSHDASLQMMATEALGNLHDPRAVDPLGSRLILIVEHEESDLMYIMNALAEIGNESAMEYLKKAEKEGNGFVSDVAGRLRAERQTKSDSAKSESNK